MMCLYAHVYVLRWVQKKKPARKAVSPSSSEVEESDVGSFDFNEGQIDDGDHHSHHEEEDEDEVPAKTSNRTKRAPPKRKRHAIVRCFCTVSLPDNIYVL